MARLGDVCSIQSGGTPLRSVADYWNDGSIPWVKISDISEKYVVSTEEHITSEGLKNSSAKIFKKGTILYTIFATLGETGILKIDAATNQAIAGITVNDTNQLNPDYLYYYLLSKKEYVNGVGRGVAQNNINMSILRNFEITIPPVVEQQEITDILEKIASAISLRQQQLDKLDQLVKSRFIEMFGDPGINPYGFDKQILKNTCNVVTGNTPSRAVKRYYGNYIEWIKTDNIVTEQLNPTIATEYLSEEGIKVGRTVEKGTILMACIAGSVASIGRVCITDRKVAFNQQINAVIPQKYDPLFLYVMLQISKDYLVQEINMALKGILSKSKLEEKEFIVPPMNYQVVFSTFVAQIDKSKFEIQQSLEKLETLKRALMQKYFG